MVGHQAGAFRGRALRADPRPRPVRVGRRPDRGRGTAQGAVVGRRGRRGSDGRIHRVRRRAEWPGWTRRRGTGRFLGRPAVTRSLVRGWVTGRGHLRRASRAALGLPRPGRSVPLGPWLAWPAPPRRRSTKGPAPLPTCRQGSLRAPRHRHRRHRQPRHRQPSPKGSHRPVGDTSVSATGRSVGRKECSHAGVRRAS